MEGVKRKEGVGMAMYSEGRTRRGASMALWCVDDEDEARRE